MGRGVAKLSKMVRHSLTIIGYTCLLLFVVYLSVCLRPVWYPEDILERSVTRKLTKSADARLRHCTQKERLDHMRYFCNISYEATIRRRMVPQPRSVINEDGKYLLCWMSKSGSTALKSVILESQGFRLANRTNRSNLNEVHGRRTLHEYGLRYLNEVPAERRWDIVNGFFNMLAIRHPFDRLLSYYRDKIVDTDARSAHPWRAAEILREARPGSFAANASLRNATRPQDALGPPTFAEFAAWLRRHRVVDEHWNFVVDACHPCAHRWHAILRTETMAADGALLLRRVGARRASVPVRHTHRGDVDEDYTEKRLGEYDSVDGQVIDYLLEFFSTDMRMFGYGWDKRTNSAVCRIDTPAGPCC